MASHISDDFDQIDVNWSATDSSLLPTSYEPPKDPSLVWVQLHGIGVDPVTGMQLALIKSFEPGALMERHARGLPVPIPRAFARTLDGR